MKKLTCIVLALVAGFLHGLQHRARRRQGHRKGWRGHPEGSQVMDKFVYPTRRPGGAARPRQRRHRRDHPQAVPEVDQAQRLRPQRLRRVALHRCRPARRIRQPSPRPLNPNFVLNQPRYQGAQILLTRATSAAAVARARAVGAAGLRLSRVIGRASPTSSSTTASRTACCRSCCRPKSTRCSRRCEATPGYRLTRSTCAAQAVIRPDGKSIAFQVDPFRKECLLNGWDDIGLTLRHADKIRAFEEKQ
jgi:3-isopropylmalate dehydratase small subunit